MADSRESDAALPDEQFEAGGEVKPFLEHLEDLRWMLIKMLATLVVAVGVAFGFARELLAIIIWPLRRVTGNPAEYLYTLEVTGGFTLAMQLALYAGVVLACPLLLYFVAVFVLPALTPREKALLRPVMVAGVGLFLAGAAMAYFIVIPAGLRFFLEYNRYLGISTRWTVDNYVSFVSHMTLAFGICFELPLVVLALAKLGLVTPRFLREKRPFVIVIIFIIAAVITPTTDMLNQALLAVPMCILYEACIWIAWWMDRSRATRNAPAT